ncbi:hypothetical protein [Agaribacter marinus]|uniref:Uncharacterized protein n=1 Tax=Agaribacter marinus TaxID=1431249 RepID=A0AA37WHX8_9ALTE|nr:hypothetical protein [Agaribacter marinus]GLR70428.1 hypothetical protein GCM10007852_13360 [Agaribacter marinus]
MNSVNPIRRVGPPKLIEKFLHWSLPPELKDPVLGDLAEEYLQLVAIQPLKANYWYTRQAMCTSLQFLTKTKRGLIMFLLGILVFIGISLLAMILGGEISMYSNVPSFLMVIPPALIITIAATSKESRKNAFALLINEDLSLVKIELRAAKHVFLTFGNLSLLMGWIGVLIGAIAMASNIDDLSYFGPAFAVCILTIFYGFFIKGLCYAAESKIQFKIISQGE